MASTIDKETFQRLTLLMSARCASVLPSHDILQHEAYRAALEKLLRWRVKS